ncbi:hypothetical protein OIU74_019538 [Salix koriyanagi]|uniref:Uncharacterized protein n=1 Tax=Salix koriyanagi TaxID=2511006 RepID=A0A9Q0SL71_9ROSI|nr:hypothetical protein OIU74_019538 [Salix koriyanagi]
MLGPGLRLIPQARQFGSGQNQPLRKVRIPFQTRSIPNRNLVLNILSQPNLILTHGSLRSDTNMEDDMIRHKQIERFGKGNLLADSRKLLLYGFKGYGRTIASFLSSRVLIGISMTQ